MRKGLKVERSKRRKVKCCNVIFDGSDLRADNQKGSCLGESAGAPASGMSAFAKQNIGFLPFQVFPEA
jgi:hypothetical protein